MTYSTAPAVEVPSVAHTLLGAPYEPALTPDSPDWPLHVPAFSVDAKDQGTSDSWVPRDPRILRLTGRHPLNCEPPMQHLMAAGFITPPSLHYVRNHGAAPKITWGEHRIVMGGLVERACAISMDELVAMPAVTLPVTLVCAGNRRKEENMVKKSIGFNWGPCAVSTSYWTGVRLRDLLLHVGAQGPAQGGGRFVCFRGPQGELPKGADGAYGTSLTWARAMDPAADVIVAYKQNGRWLTPDHGFPVRIIIPGVIGGRMVKWLSEITVESQESQNHYHFFDNRVLPSHVDQDLATKEGWWYKPDFIINDLNINSAIAKPWHDEVLMLNDATTSPTYEVKGYAYAGGGRKIIRVEISLDRGVSWRLADIRRFEEPNEYGKHWCWVHWDIQVPVFDFFRSKELLLRAWDEGMNTQPAMITWNVMGMMNNCHFRVLIHPHTDTQGNIGVRFQHPAPTEVGALGHVGWREEQNLRMQALDAAGIPTLMGPLPPVNVKGAAPALAPAPAHSPASLSPPLAKKLEVVTAGGGVSGDVGAGSPVISLSCQAGRGITQEEVAQHNSEQSAWFVHEGKVYDATPFLYEHPGGADSIVCVAGMDATEDFNAIHSRKAKAMLADYYIGDLIPSPLNGSHTSSSANGAPVINANGSHANSVAAANTVDAPASENGIHSTDAASSSTAASICTGASNGPAKQELVTLNPRAKVSLTLSEKIAVSHNTRIFRFALPSPLHRLGLPTGQHLFVYGKVEGQTVARAYTPISCDEDVGRLDLLVKVYPAQQHPSFPEGGKMSQHLDSLSVGDEIQVKGPVGHFVYQGRGRYVVHGRQRGVARRLSMLAGGTGITPLYQVLRAVLSDPCDPTCCSLLYANQGEADILMRQQLDDLASRHPDRFKVHYVLSAPPSGWPGSTGRITQALMREHLFPADEHTLGLMCGPPGLLQGVAVPGLNAMGYARERQVVF